MYPAGCGRVGVPWGSSTPTAIPSCAMVTCPPRGAKLSVGSLLHAVTLCPLLGLVYSGWRGTKKGSLDFPQKEVEGVLTF